MHITFNIYKRKMLKIIVNPEPRPELFHRLFFVSFVKIEPVLLTMARKLCVILHRKRKLLVDATKASHISHVVYFSIGIQILCFTFYLHLLDNINPYCDRLIINSFTPICIRNDSTWLQFIRFEIQQNKIGNLNVLAYFS